MSSRPYTFSLDTRTESLPCLRVSSGSSSSISTASRSVRDQVVLAGQGSLEYVVERGEVAVGDRVRSPGNRATDAVAGSEQQVDERAGDGEPAVAQGAQEVLAGVGQLQHAVQAEHARRTLDGVRVAEQSGDRLPRLTVALELEQPSLQRRETLLDLGPERRDQLRVVDSPACHLFSVDTVGGDLDPYALLHSRPLTGDFGTSRARARVRKSPVSGVKGHLAAGDDDMPVDDGLGRCLSQTQSARP